VVLISDSVALSQTPAEASVLRGVTVQLSAYTGANLYCLVTEATETCLRFLYRDDKVRSQPHIYEMIIQVAPPCHPHWVTVQSVCVLETIALNTAQRKSIFLTCRFVSSRNYKSYMQISLRQRMQVVQTRHISYMQQSFHLDNFSARFSNQIQLNVFITNNHN